MVQATKTRPDGREETYTRADVEAAFAEPPLRVLEEAP